CKIITTFPQAVLWAAIDLRRKRKKKKKKKKKRNNNNANGYNRCHRTSGAWPLNIAASSNCGAKHNRGRMRSLAWQGATDRL
ncbi:hypothetical protein M9458_057955, partial [Cirrhinus mrigala]